MYKEGFLEDITGMTKLANGAYVQSSNPIYKEFRWAFTVTDQDGGEIVYNFPKYQVDPVSFNAETETDEKKENYQQIIIRTYPVIGVKDSFQADESAVPTV